MIISKKLKAGDEIRVIAPSSSVSRMKKIHLVNAQKLLTDKGFSVTFGKNAMLQDEFMSSPIRSRIGDLHDAFKDKNVKAIIAAIGGSTSNQLLKHIDYKLVSDNPKIFLGLSDATCLANAFYAKTGLVTYSGPHLPVLGAEKCTDYSWEYFEKCLMLNEEFEILPSQRYCNKRFDSRTLKNEGHWQINKGQATGVAIGGNLLTFTFLQGSEYAPSYKNSILFLEDTGKESFRDFQNQLQSILNQKESEGIKGIVVGRFQKDTGMTRDLLSKIIKSKHELKNVPVLGNVDFGHTTPTITFPIGGKVELVVRSTSSVLTIKH